MVDEVEGVAGEAEIKREFLHGVKRRASPVEEISNWGKQETFSLTSFLTTPSLPSSL